MTELLVVVRPTPDQAPSLPARKRVLAQRGAARIALKKAAALVGCGAQAFPQEEEGGRPLPVDGWHWSISHDATLVAAVLHREPVGVDLEQVAERRAAMHDKVATEAERELLAPWNARAFTQLWTAKEAVLKAAGVGLTELSLCRLVGREGEDLLLDHHGGPRRVRQTSWGQHLLAVHAPGADWSVSWDLPAG